VETEREKLRHRSFTSRSRNAVETELERCANVRHFTFQEKAGFTADQHPAPESTQHDRLVRSAQCEKHSASGCQKQTIARDTACTGEPVPIRNPIESRESECFIAA
jgi:hypothetical protein